MSALASDMAGKRLELLKEAVPHAQRVAVLWNSDNPSKVAEWKDTQEAAGHGRARLQLGQARSRDELEVALRGNRQAISRMRCSPLPRVLPSACASGSEALPWPAGCR